MRRTLWVLALLVAPAASQAAGAEATDYWKARFQGEVKTGAIHVVRREVSEKGETLLKTEETRDFAYFQGGEVQWKQFLSVWETAEGAVRRFEISSTTDKGRTVVEARVEDGTARFFYKAPGGDPKEYEKPWNAAIIGPAAAERRRRAEGTARGVRYRYTTYAFDSLQEMTVTVSGRGRARVRTLEGERELGALKVETSLGRGSYTWEYRDGKGAFVMSALSEGTRVEARMDAAAAQKRQAGVLALYPVSGAVTVPGAVYRPRAVRSSILKLEVTGKADLGRLLPLDAPGQKAAGGGRSVTLTVATAEGKASQPRPVKDEAFGSCLEAGYFTDFGDADGGMGAKASALAGGEKTCLDAARRLSAWIAENTAKRPLNSGFAVASDTFARREGDCSELAVLLCAMARSVGVPARLAGGFCLQGGQLVFHVWTEVWDRRWHPLDPTNPGGGFDALHYRFGATDLKGPAPEYVLLSAGSVVRQLRVVSLEYWLEGQRLRPGEMPDASHAENGDTYTNRLLGFSFRKPGHWRFTTNLRGITGGVVAVTGSGRRERVLFRPHMAEYSLSYEVLLRRMEVHYDVGEPREIRVGGRRAVVVPTSMRGGGYSPLTCYVRVGGVLYAIESNDCSEDCKKAFETVLASLSFREGK